MKSQDFHSLASVTVAVGEKVLARSNEFRCENTLVLTLYNWARCNNTTTLEQRTWITSDQTAPSIQSVRVWAPAAPCGDGPLPWSSTSLTFCCVLPLYAARAGACACYHHRHAANMGPFCIQGLRLHHPSGSLELVLNGMFFQSYEEVFISDLFWWLLRTKGDEGEAKFTLF